MPVYIFEFAAKPPRPPRKAGLLVVTIEIMASNPEDAAEIFKKEVTIHNKHRFKSAGTYDKQLNYYSE